MDLKIYSHFFLDPPNVIEKYCCTNTNFPITIGKITDMKDVCPNKLNMVIAEKDNSVTVFYSRGVDK